MVLWIKALTVLPVDHSSILSTHLRRLTIPVSGLAGPSVL